MQFYKIIKYANLSIFPIHLTDSGLLDGFVLVFPLSFLFRMYIHVCQTKLTTVEFLTTS